MDNEGKLKEEEGGEKDEWDDGEGGDDVEEQMKAVQFERESEAKCEEKRRERQINLDAKAHHPPEKFFRTLDSSVKKNSTFIKKLNSLTEASRDKLVQDLNSLNLTKYIEEVVNAICGAKIKMQDINCAVHLCSLLHRRYADFSPLVLKTLQSSLSSNRGEDKVTRCRIELRLLGQLLVMGVITDQKEGFSLLHTVLNNIVTNDTARHEFLPAIVSFVKHCGEDIVGIVPHSNKQLIDRFGVTLSTMQILPKDKQNIFYNLLRDYLTSVLQALVRLHHELAKYLRGNRRTLQMKGEVPIEKIEEAERLHALHSKLMINSTALADLLAKDMPDLPPLDSNSLEEEETASAKEGDMNGMDIWEDEDSKTFYEDIFDMTGIVPQILYKKKLKEGEEEKVEEKPKELDPKEKEKEEEKSEDVSEEALEVELNKLTLEEKELEEEAEDEEEEPVVALNTAGAGQIMMSNKLLMEAYLAKLPTLSNRDFVNEAAQEFCLRLNTKSNRKKLVRALYGVSRNRLDLLPFHARLVATLSPILPDIAPDLFTLLKKEFLYHLRKKDQSNLETKIKNIRFIGELTKFNMCSKTDALWCYRALLEQFTHHNVEIACSLVESCGRFLFRTPESHLKTNHLLEQMMRKKTVHNLDTRQITMVENAYFYCNPPERVAYEKKIRPPIHDYIRKILMKDLNKLTIEKVLRQFRKLPWNNPEVAQYAVKCLSRVWLVKYNNIYCVASLLSGLSQFQDTVGILVVDNVLEAIRVGMELNQPHLNQRRVAEAKLLAELYNYRMVESNVVFNTLYLLISFGTLPDGTNPIDPPEATVRIRIILTVLDTCGQYFEKGSLKKKCDVFLLFFQKYLFTRLQPLPLDVDYAVQDSLEVLRPNLSLHDNVADVDTALCAISSHFKDSLGPGMSMAAMASSDEEEEEDEDTPTEAEEDEGDEEENEDVALSKGLETVTCAEDDDFISELEKTMLGELTGRNNSFMKVNSSELALPMNRGFKEHEIVGSNMKFSVMLKKGSKQQFKQMDIPLDSQFAANLFEKQQAVIKEKEEMKRLVLTHEQRQEEEELLAELADSPTKPLPMRAGGDRRKPRKAPQLTTEMFNFASSPNKPAR